ncbi:MAG: type I glyceraldehyde-3-phosphate dehydrogenase [Wolinella sp.]
MSPLRIAINGFGRIGRSVARVIAQRSDVELVAINDLASPETLAYLLRHDSVHGAFPKEVSWEENRFYIGEKEVLLYQERDPQKLDFSAASPEVVIESTGLFLTQELVKHHLQKGVKRVIFSAPAKDSTPTYVLGVNHECYQGEPIISNASCTTNCLAPLAMLLDEAFGIEKGIMTTIHAYTNDQNILDTAHRSDFRRSRAAAINMIPTTTGAAKALGLVLPSLQGKLHGHSVRVPTPDVSMVDLNVKLAHKSSAQAINELFMEASQGRLKGILGVDKDFGVSLDFQGDPRSSIVASDLTFVIEGDMAKVMAWYDNEWGYSNRLVDMARFITSL